MTARSSGEEFRLMPFDFCFDALVFVGVLAFERWNLTLQRVDMHQVRRMADHVVSERLDPKGYRYLSP